MRRAFYLSLLVLCFSAINGSKTSAQTYFYEYYSIADICGVDSGSLYIKDTAFDGTFYPPVHFLYGDGSSDTQASYLWPSSFGAGGYCNFNHNYSASGIYTIKGVLLDSMNIAIDSISFFDTVTCNSFPIRPYNDVNGDCIYDAGDIFIPYPATIEVDSAGIAIDTLSDLDFVYDYSSSAPAGTIYSFRVIGNPEGMTLSCPTSGIIYDTVGVFNGWKTIGFTCSPSSTFDLWVAADFSAGMFVGYSGMYIGSTSCSSVPATLTINYSPQYSIGYLQCYQHVGWYDYPYTPSYAVSGNTVVINIGPVSLDSGVYIFADLLPVTILSAGDTVNTTFTVTPFSGDTDTSNNVVTTVDTIYSSYDPNYKSVMPSGSIAPGTKLQYMLSFENTGNDTAFNIHLMDTLSNNLDISTFKIITSSAPVFTYKLSDGSSNVLKFDLPHINLLDSSHHGQDMGFVTYSINAKPGLSIGTKIDNRAGIYFDDNAVVMTNTVENSIGVNERVSTLTNTAKIEAYPNPVGDKLYVTGLLQNTDYRLLSVTGICVQQGVLLQGNNTVSTQNIIPGVYILELTNQDGSKNMVRIIKE